MKTTIFIVVLSAACGYAQSSGRASSSHYPAFVKRLSFTNQTTLFAPTPLYTPKKDGLFRVSVYTEQISAGSEGEFVCPSLINTDDSGVTQSRTGANDDSECVASPDGTGGQPGVVSGTIVFVVRAKANTPISLTTQPYGSLSSGSSYSVYVAIERL